MKEFLNEPGISIHIYLEKLPFVWKNTYLLKYF